MAQMHPTASPAWESWFALAARLPADLNLNQLARTTNAVQRRRGDGIEDGTALLRLSLARGPGGKSLQETAAWAHLNGIAELTSQSLNERLHRSVSFLAAITHRLLAGRPLGKPALWSGRCLRIADGSSLSQPGSKGTDWRLHTVYDLSQGGFSHVEVTDRCGAESLLRCAPVANEVLIADRGYARARELRACLDPTGPDAREFIVRVGWKALALCDPAGKPFSLIGHLETLAATAGPQEYAVQAVVGRSRQPALLALRLIAVPLPPDKAAANRAKLQRRASKHQDELDRRSLTAAGFMVLVTSLPSEIPTDEICAAYRLRWQVELAIKRLKSLIHIDRLPTRTPNGGLSWLYPHLILLLLSEDICQDFLESSPCGNCCQRTVLTVAVTQAGTRRRRRGFGRVCAAGHYRGRQPLALAAG
jgi:Transposase DDE domain